MDGFSRFNKSSSLLITPKINFKNNFLASDGKGPRKVVGAFNAGKATSNGHKMLESGQCVRISTGAKLPEEADAVVKLEDTEVLEEDVCVGNYLNKFFCLF